MGGHEKLTIAEFISQNEKNFPCNFIVCEGHSSNEEISKGDRFKAIFVTSKVVNVKYDDGTSENFSANSSILFAILFDPFDDMNEAKQGYSFKTVSEVVNYQVLPPVLWSKKSFHGFTPDSLVSANELFIVRDIVDGEQLKVYSHTYKKEKTLGTNCFGDFSTKPQDTGLYLSDIMKCMPGILQKPCKAVMLKVDAPPRIVTLSMSSIDSSLVISRQVPQATMFEISINLEILVKLDRSDHIYEELDQISPVTPVTVQEGKFHFSGMNESFKSVPNKGDVSKAVLPHSLDIIHLELAPSPFPLYT